MRTFEEGVSETFVYVPAPPGRAPARALAVLFGPCAGRRFVFHDQIEIGRLIPGVAALPGTLWVANPTVSRRHCVISQDADGRCFVRDVSRNGTHVDNHRLVPGAEVELKPGQVLHLARGAAFQLEGVGSAGAVGPVPRPTIPVRAETMVTMLVGDIRQYTTLVRETPAEVLQQSVNALFRELERRVTDLDGTVKEYPGDAILAYWECAAPESCAVRACRAALALDQAARRLAEDREVWRLADRPLQMDWALASGEVLIDSLGGAHPVGLSMVGAPVVLAHRLEKLAGDQTGGILACGCTRELAAEAFRFRELGSMSVVGFTSPQAVFVLEGAR